MLDSIINGKESLIGLKTLAFILDEWLIPSASLLSPRIVLVSDRFPICTRRCIPSSCLTSWSVYSRSLENIKIKLTRLKWKFLPTSTGEKRRKFLSDNEFLLIGPWMYVLFNEKGNDVVSLKTKTKEKELLKAFLDLLSLFSFLFHYQTIDRHLE